MEELDGNGSQDVDMGGMDGDGFQDFDMGEVNRSGPRDAEMAASDASSGAALEVEGATDRLQIDQTEQEQRLHSQESIQAHLKVVDRAKYSKIPKFPAAKKKDTKPSRNGSTLRFTSNIRSEPSKRNPGASHRVRNLAKDMHYNTRKFDEAKIDIKNEVLFDSSILSLTTNSLDHYLRQCLSRPPLNSTNITICVGERFAFSGKLSVALWNTGLTLCGKPNHSNQFSWMIGAMGPGEQFYQADPDEVQTLLDRLCYILQRVQAIDFPTSKSRSRFLLCIFNRLIRHANPAFKLKATLYSHYYVKFEGGLLQLGVKLYGFDLQSTTNMDFYHTWQKIVVPMISLKPLKTPFEDRYVHVEVDCGEQTETPAFDLIRSNHQKRSLELQRRLQHINDSDEKAQFEKAQRLARTMLYTFDGFLDPKSHLQRLVTGLKIAHDIREPQGGGTLGLYRDRLLVWYFRQIKKGSMIKPSDPVKQDVSGLPGIYLASNITGRWPPVLQAMLHELVKGRNIADVWRAGCVAADTENARIFEGVAPTRLRCRCAKNGLSLHPCELCLRPFKCNALRQPPSELSTRRFCARCYKRACQLLEERKKKATSPFLLERVRAGVRDDLKQIHGPSYLVHRGEIESRVKGIWNELQSQALEEEGVIYAWKDSYVADTCGDSAQGEWNNVALTVNADHISANVGSVREVWLGHIVSPFTASPDGVFQVALNADKNVGYHIPGNISITSQAFNFFLDRYPPICLPLTEKSRLAEGRKDLDEVSKAFCNIVTTMNSIPKLKKDRNRLRLNEQQMAELHNALRTAQPGPKPRRYYGWHAPGDGPGIGCTYHLRTVQEAHIVYQYTQLYNIRKLPKYRRIIQDDPEFCFKKGVFFPFSASAPVEYWYEHNNQTFFEYQLRTKDRYCDRSSKHHHKTNTSLMMFQTYRNCLDMALENGKKRDGTWTIQDKLGLEPWPLLNMPWTASIGHIVHGEPMITGYPPGVAYPENQEDYDEERNNMTWESWGWNHEKRSMGDEPELLEKMLARHRNLRPTAEVKRFWEMVDNLRVDSDYVTKITDARRQWRGRKKQASDKDMKEEHSEGETCSAGGTVPGGQRLAESAEKAEKEAEKAEKAKKEAEKALKAKKEAEKEAEKAEKAKKEAEKTEKAEKEAENAEKAKKEAEKTEKAEKETEKSEKAEKEAEKARNKESTAQERRSEQSSEADQPGLYNSDLDEGDLDEGDLDEEDLNGEDLNGEDLDGEDLPGEDLNGEDLNGEDLDGEDLDGEDLDGEDLNGEDLDGEDLSGEDLDGEDLDGEDLDGEDQSMTEGDATVQEPENETICSSDEWENEEDFMLEQNRKEIHEIYSCLETIRTTASAKLIEIIRKPISAKQKSSKRRYISDDDESDIKVQNQAKRLKSNFDSLSLIADLKNWKQLSDIDFNTKVFQMLKLLDHERIRRDQNPDNSYDTKQENDKCRIRGYQVRYGVHRFTDWEFYHFHVFWSKEISRLIELRRARRHHQDSANTGMISESVSTMSLG